MQQGQGEARLDSEGISDIGDTSDSWPRGSHLVITGSHAGSLGHGLRVALTSHLLCSLPGRVCQHYHRCPRKAEGDAGSGLGTQRMEGGTQMPPHPSKGGSVLTHLLFSWRLQSHQKHFRW